MLLDYPDILSVEQVCEILQTSKRTVYNLIRNHKLTAKKLPVTIGYTKLL